MTTIPVCLVALLTSAAPTGRGEVLDFSARWCGPCQQMAPLVARLEREGLPIRSVDVDDNAALKSRFNITAMPTFVLVEDGREVARKTGMMSEQELRSWLAHIPKDPAPQVAEAAPARGQSPATSPSRAPFVADRNVRLGTPQSIAAAAQQEPARQPDPVQESRPAPQREEIATAEEQPRQGIWPFRTASHEESTATEQLAAEIRASDSPLIDPPARQTPAGGPMASSVRLRVTIDGHINLGSGTIIESAPGSALIVTCGHVFRGFAAGSQIEVNYFADGREQSLMGELVKFDIEADVGLVRVECPQALPAVLVARDVQQAHEQDSVTSIGCSGGQPPTSEELVVTAVNPYLGPENLECTGVPVQGRSGGGLFREGGELVGICIAADPARKRGVYAGLKAIHDLLAQAGKSHLYQTPPATAVATNDVGPQDFPATGGEMMNASGEPPRRSLFDSAFPSQADAAPQVATAPEAQISPVLFNTQTTPQPGPASPVSLGPNSDDAEIVCIIRPHNQPQGASQVVIIHQASPKMLSYLRGELGDAPAGSSPSSLLSHADRSVSLADPQPAPTALERLPLSRVSRTMAHRQPDLQATSLTAPATPRRYVRTR